MRKVSIGFVMSVVECVVSNAAIATALALLAALVGRVTTKPQITHTLWVLVLVKLVTPPVVHIPEDYSVSAAVALKSSGESVKNVTSDPLSPTNYEPIERDEDSGALSSDVSSFPSVPNQGAGVDSRMPTVAPGVSWTKALVGVWALESYTNEGVTKSADDVGGRRRDILSRSAISCQRESLGRAVPWYTHRHCR